MLISFEFNRWAMAVAAFAVVSAAYGSSPSIQTAPPATHFSHLRFTTPAKWKCSQNGNWMILTPDDVPQGEAAYIGISPGGETIRTLEDEFDLLIKASQHDFTTIDSKPAKTSNDLQGIRTIQQTVALQNPAGGKFLRLYIGKKNGNRFEAMTFTATANVATKYFPAFKDFYSSLNYEGTPAPANSTTTITTTETTTTTTAVPAEAPITTVTTTTVANRETRAGAILPPAAPAKPLTDSGAVTRTANGEFVVPPAKDGGIKISKHDKQIFSAATVVGHDGTIHVAYGESTTPNVENAIYYRSSSDGGHTWTEAKNLSEVLPGYMVGDCKIAVDASDRVYVIWRTAGEPNVGAFAGSHAGNLSQNVVYRVLEGGHWNGSAINVNTPATHATQDAGAGSFFAGSDPTGKVHVAYVLNTDVFHPDLMYNAGTSYPQHFPSMFWGSVAQVDLNGTSPTAPREVFLTKITGDKNDRQCDGFDNLQGYFDSEGKPHFAALTTRRGEPDGANRIMIIEDGQQKPGIVLPGPQFSMWAPPSVLLLDSKGRKHIVALFAAGEQHGIRDYLIGSDSEPTLIRPGTSGLNTILGFEACQGPGGQMIVLMQMNDGGKIGEGDLYLSVSSGDGWTKPVNVSNNANRTKSTYTPTAPRASVTTITKYMPGLATATYDKTGHLILIHERDELGVFGANAYGITLASGDSAVPRLYFMRF